MNTRRRRERRERRLDRAMPAVTNQTRIHSGRRIKNEEKSLTSTARCHCAMMHASTDGVILIGVGSRDGIGSDAVRRAAARVALEARPPSERAAPPSPGVPAGHPGGTDEDGAQARPAAVERPLVRRGPVLPSLCALSLEHLTLIPESLMNPP